MIAHVVPVTRLRRATDWWSYRVPGRFSVTAGSLVSIPFHGRTLLGVVWNTQPEDSHAKESILEVFTAFPLVREPHRRFIEWLAEAGICSLSSALYFWLPSSLRTYPLRPYAKSALLELGAWKPSPAELQGVHQQLMLVPGDRPDITTSLREKFTRRFAALYATSPEKEELIQWVRVAKGEIQVGLGRERALCAPWLNLKKSVVIEPEDISFFHEQIPYLDLTEAVRALSSSFKAEKTVRSYVPDEAAKKLWGETAQGATTFSSPTLVDLRKNRILNDELLTKIRTTLEKKQQVVILYNAKDKKAIREDGTVLVPGIETLSKQLATSLGLSSLPPDIIFGTRAIFNRRYPRVGLTVALALEPLLRQSSFRDQLHGCADLLHLLSYEADSIMQSYDMSHPLVHALRNKKLAEYCTELVAEQEENHLPPFAEYIVCSLKDGSETTTTPDALYEKLASLQLKDWQISYPFQALRHKLSTTNVLLSAPLGTRLPQNARQLLAATPRPWKVQRNPWYTL